MKTLTIIIFSAIFLGIIPLAYAESPPVVNWEQVTIPELTSICVNVLANDFDVDNNIDPSTVNVVFPPYSGTYEVTPEGEICYTNTKRPTGGGTLDNLRYTVLDTTGLVSNEEWLYIYLEFNVTPDPLPDDSIVLSNLTEVNERLDYLEMEIEELEGRLNLLEQVLIAIHFAWKGVFE